MFANVCKKLYINNINKKEFYNSFVKIENFLDSYYFYIQIIILCEREKS